MPTHKPVRALPVILLAAACASLPEDYPQTESRAIDAHESTIAGRLFERAEEAHPGYSGFTLITGGREAFTARIGLSDLAEKSLDLQYYIWEADATGHILAERLVRAADRGVRVRILVDDISASGRDERIAVIAAHPNIEIRIFNPFANRNATFVDFIGDFSRVNHRMHNKIMVVDNAIAVVGGRNIGDIYFQVASEANYRDLDIAAAGPIVRDVSAVFDHFWNGPWAVPIEALHDRSYTEDELRHAVEDLRRQIPEDNYPHPLDRDVEDLREALETIRERLIWAPGRIVWDDPAEIETGSADGAILRGLRRKVETLDDRLLIESAYFVMRDPAVEKLRELEARGVEVRVLTNSLASNDVIAAHAGHAAHRKDLIAAGVDMFEMRADADAIQKSVVSGESRASLHTKAMVFDDDAVFIGSFNLDPRSATINTEAGIYVESAALAARLTAFMDEGVKPENSYRVVLDEDDDLVWLTANGGREVRLDEEPGASFFNSFMTGLIQILPVEGLL